MCDHIDTIRMGDREFCKDCQTFVPLGHAKSEVDKIEQAIIDAILLANTGRNR